LPRNTMATSRSSCCLGARTAPCRRLATGSVRPWRMPVERPSWSRRLQHFGVNCGAGTTVQRRRSLHLATVALASTEGSLPKPHVLVRLWTDAELTTLGSLATATSLFVGGLHKHRKILRDYSLAIDGKSPGRDGLPFRLCPASTGPKPAGGRCILRALADRHPSPLRVIVRWNCCRLISGPVSSPLFWAAPTTDYYARRAMWVTPAGAAND
jgi:hypothetical protein